MVYVIQSIHFYFLEWVWLNCSYLDRWFWNKLFMDPIYTSTFHIIWVLVCLYSFQNRLILHKWCYCYILIIYCFWMSYWWSNISQHWTNTLFQNSPWTLLPSPSNLSSPNLSISISPIPPSLKAMFITHCPLTSCTIYHCTS